jgi:ornithine decarboxylase
MFADAHIHYMHPIKPEAAVREAYFSHGVRDFSLDSVEEIEKIVRATEFADDLGLFIRIAMPKGSAKFDLSAKFGATVQAAAELLRLGRPVARRLGVCFHVGSQCLDPAAYGRALDMAGQAIRASGVAIDIVDVGGGFPVAYPGEVPPDLNDYFAAIAAGVQRLGLPASTRIWCEPGRALVAAGASVVVRVEAVRAHAEGRVLHINDGVFGSLADAGAIGMRFPTRALRASEAALVETAFYGPTCDSADFMAGPFLVPADVKAGDYIELGQLGAYGTCLRTAFNGFDRVLIADVIDRPLIRTPGHPDVLGSGAVIAPAAPKAA